MTTKTRPKTVRGFQEPTGTKRYADRIESPVGDIWLLVDEADALVTLEFEGARQAPRDERDFEEALAERGLELSWNARKLGHVRRVVRDYFRGKTHVFDVVVAPAGTSFQREVWRELCEIPHGEAISYGELAERVGRPGAARAVGRANGTNPVALVIPCHRVIGADGSLTGYGGGMERKHALLTHEGFALDPWSAGLGAGG